MEIELKFLVDPRDMEKLSQHPLLHQHATTEPREQELVSTYFDTPDRQAQQQQVALRVRRVGDAWVQTLKGGGEVNGGLHQRHEWETPVAGPALDLVALRRLVDKHNCGGKLIRDRDITQNLEPVFTTNITRTIIDLRLPGGLEVECALDQGAVVSGELQDPICELELERVAGDAYLLFDFALQLAAAMPLRLGERSKAERGYALGRPQALSVKATPLVLEPTLTVEQAYRKIVSACITHIQHNEPGVVEHQHAEAIHQMRVGMRRLRSALRQFDRVIPVDASMLAELRWCAAQLGAARDWDVLAGTTLPALQQDGAQDELPALCAAAGEVARERRKAAAQAIASSRYTVLILRLSQWLQRAAWRENMHADAIARLSKPVRKFADRVLTDDQARLRRRGRRLGSADAAARHRVRIAAKKTRYAAEFFQSLYRDGQMRRYVAALSALQDQLGAMNDTSIADGLLHQLGQQDGALAAMAGYARGRLSVAPPAKERALRTAWKRFAAMDLPQRKGD